MLPQFFAAEFEKAKIKALTHDCRENECNGCGVCDFKTIEPVLNDVLTDSFPAGGMDAKSLKRLPDEAFQKFDLTFSKLHQARFFGHLELATIVRRAVKRTGFAAKFSQGFNPSMRLAFDNALPVGMESEQERFFIYLDKTLSTRTIQKQLNEQLPLGLSITGCERFQKNVKSDEDISHYVIRFAGVDLEKDMVNDFLNMTSFVFEDLSKRVS